MQLIDQNRDEIALESTLLMGGLVAMLSAAAGLIFGVEGLLFGPLTLLMFWLVEAKVPVSWVLRAHRALPVPADHPAARMFAGICRRAGIDSDARLYYAPSRNFNAYTIGHSAESAVVLNTPILEYFTDQEIAGILAHELSHVANRDTRFMAIAASIATMISQISFILIITCLITLPIAFAQGAVLSYLGMIVIALFMPTVAMFLQAKLSRTREFAADLGATELLGDPGYLISALLKLERYSGAFLLPWIRRGQDYFGTHPNTIERIERLKSLQPPHYPSDHPRARWF